MIWTSGDQVLDTHRPKSPTASTTRTSPVKVWRATSPALGEGATGAKHDTLTGEHVVGSSMPVMWVRLPEKQLAKCPVQIAFCPLCTTLHYMTIRDNTPQIPPTNRQLLNTLPVVFRVTIPNLMGMKHGPRAHLSHCAFPVGAKVLVDGKYKHTVVQAFPEGSTSLLFAHYVLRPEGAHGPNYTMVAWDRVSVTPRTTP